jgi:hypothetical protein
MAAMGPAPRPGNHATPDQVVDPVGVADHRIGHATAPAARPVGVRTRPEDLQAEHQLGVPEHDLDGQRRAPGTLRRSRAGDPEILVHHHLLTREPQLDRARHQPEPVGRLDVTLQLRLVGLADTRTPTGADVRSSTSSARSPRQLRSTFAECGQLQRAQRQLVWPARA